jgi:hypothetical protein
MLLQSFEGLSGRETCDRLGTRPAVAGRGRGGRGRGRVSSHSADRDDIDGFHDRLASQRSQVVPDPSFGDGGHVFRLGFAYEPADRLEKGPVVISAALDADPA